MRKIILIICILLLIPFTIYAKLTMDLTTNGYYFNNADFINYDHDLYAANPSVAYLNSDDALPFVYANIALDYSRKYKHSEFFLSIYRSGFWGTDNLEGRDEGNNPILFKKLYFVYYPIKDFSIQLGRFYYNIGDTTTDYFFGDNIDALMLSYKYSSDISFQFEGDILGIGAKPEGTRIWFGIEKDEELVEDFNGNVISYRAGLVTKLYFAKVFNYFLKYGATSEGGADIAENGRNTLNEADNDFLTMNGVRFFHDFDEFGSGDFTFAYSYGRDYQYDSTKVYNGFGTALNYSLELEIDYLKKVGLSTGYFHPDFISMKANSMGGLLLWAYKGYFASPYAYFYHFKDYQKEESGQTYVDKTVSKTFVKVNFTFKLWKVDLILSSLVLFANEEALSIVYMGIENELKATVRFDNITVEAYTGVYVPSGYYLERSIDNTYIPAGDDPFYMFGLSVKYGLDWE